MNIMDIQDIQFESRIKRGRPPSSSLPTKILEGLTSDSHIKCSKCNRSFPRNKSLQAHLRTHTGEKPYLCDWPGCNAAFTQSGHLRSHAYRHSGEKPYGCPMDGCSERYIHSNRHCSIHKSLKLVRDGKEVLRSDLENLSEAEAAWLQRYKDKKYSKGSPSKTTDNPNRKRSIDSAQLNEESSDQELCSQNSVSSTASQNSLSSSGTNSETSGYCSFSERSSSPADYVISEVNDVCESFSPSPKKRNLDVGIDINDIEAARILMDIKNGAWRSAKNLSV